MKAGKSAARQPSDQSCVTVPWLRNLGAVGKTDSLSHLQGCSILCCPQLSPGWQVLGRLGRCRGAGSLPLSSPGFCALLGGIW